MDVVTERLGLNRQFACFEKFCCKEMHRQVDINHQRTHDDHALHDSEFSVNLMRSVKVQSRMFPRQYCLQKYVLI